MRRIIHIAPLLLLLALAAALNGCSSGNAQTRSADAPVPVRVAAVSVERAAVPVVATGTLGPKDDVTLSFKVGGVVARVLVDEGQSVAAGQLLASLDFGEIDPGVARARAAADKADRDLARAKRLYADSVATLEQLQNAETARDAAQAEYDAASFNRRHASIVAPSAGVILRRSAEPGELVQPGSAILSLGSRSRGQVMRVWLADRDVVRIRRGDRAVAQFDAFPGQAFEGEVREIAAAADPMTGTFKVEIALPISVGPGSGLVGSVEIRPTAQAAVALVPAEAVLEADGSRGVVYTVDADRRTAHRRAVTVAYLAGARIAIAAGLEGVRDVVTDGAAYLDDGRAVEVRP
jgi:RND family efflux transporter MFP subunit